MYESMKPKKTGIDPLAFVSPKAKVAENVYIGAFAYISDGADMAKKEYFRLKDDMTQEEINVVTEHLKKNSLIRYEELFGV